MEAVVSESEIGTGEETKVEKLISNYMGVGIHMLLSVLALLLVIAACIATFDTVVRDFPTLWHPQDQYVALQKIVENLLLIAIAIEFALLLLFRRMSAVVEVVVFVLARKAVNPEITALELVMCSFAIAGLIVLRFYFWVFRDFSGRGKKSKEFSAFEPRPSKG